VCNGESDWHWYDDWNDCWDDWQCVEYGDCCPGAP
jgi:hypothetical protein